MDHGKHLVRMHQHVVIPEAQEMETILTQPSGARRIGHGFKVLAAIDLDGKLCFQTGKINDERANRKLSPEPETVYLTTPKMEPQAALRIRHVAPEFSREKLFCTFAH